MSNWTHVASIFRIDDVTLLDKKNRPDLDKVFGKECVLGETDDKSLDEFSKEWKKMVKAPEKYLPHGSEGSLRKLIWENPDPHMMAHYTVAVWGDLRDHESIEEIEEWFHDCCRKLKGWVRQASCAVSNDLNGSKTVVYRLDEVEKPGNEKTKSINL